MPKNDFTASAGISMEQWKKDIASMSAEMAKISASVKQADASLQGIEKTTESAAKSTGFLAKALGVLGIGFGAKKAIDFAKAVNNTAVTLNDAARAADTTVESLTSLQLATSGQLSKDEFTAGISALTEKLDAAKAGSVEASEALKELGVVGGKADEAFITIAEHAQKAGVTTSQLAKVFGSNARAIQDAIAQPNLRGRAGAAGGGNSEAAANIKGFGRGIGNIGTRLMEGAVNVTGGLIGAGKQALSGDLLGTQRALAEKKAAEAPIAAKKKEQEQVVDLAKAESERLDLLLKQGISIEDRVEKERAETDLLDQQIQAANKAYGINSLISKQLQEQKHQHDLNKEALEFELHEKQKTAEANTEIKDAELAGNAQLAALKKNQLTIDAQIRQAKREGRDDVAEQLRQQQRLNELEIKAAAYRMTPQQRRDERKEQEAQDLAIRHINAMEKNNPNSVAADGRNHVSKAAAKARAEYAARHALPNVNDAKKQLNDITANTIIVNQIKGA